MGSRLLVPDPVAEELAHLMLDEDSVQQEILQETIEKGQKGQIKESGRTVCPGGRQVEGPLGRFPTSVRLATCPREAGGTWHTHVTADELRNPENSLPDIANVVFGLSDVSVVSGTESAEAVFRPEDPEAMRDAFEEAVGVEMNEPDDVFEAIQSGRVDPSRAQQRVRQRLSPVIVRRRTGYHDLDGQITPEVPLGGAAGVAANETAFREAQVYGEHFRGGLAADICRCNDQITTEFVRAGQDVENGIAGLDLRDLIVSQAIGTIVGEATTRIVFDR